VVGVLAKLEFFLNQYYEKANQHQKLIWFIFSVFAIAFVLSTVIWCYNLIFTYPVNQVSQITNVTESADLVNKYRTTSVQIVAIIAQIFGGIAILIGLYFAWGNLTTAREGQTTAREGQITERFTRAIDQLGNRKMEIRLGGIYALERIANESEKDYWPIMKILAAYIREKSYVKENTVTEDYEQQEKGKSLSTDIQVILDLICKREHSFNEKLDLRNSKLRNAQLIGAHLEEADLKGAHLEEADLKGAHLEGADLQGAHLEGARLVGAHLNHNTLFVAPLEESDFIGTHLEIAGLWELYLEKAYFSGANLERANLERANLKGANLEGTNLEGTNLEGTKNLTVDQLSKVKTLHNAKLNEELLIPLTEQYPSLFEEPKK
jgi:uncharacterized protein YjbI with pentapeptide repeats